MSKIDLDQDFDYKDNEDFSQIFWKIFWAVVVLAYCFSFSIVFAFLKIANSFLN